MGRGDIAPNNLLFEPGRRSLDRDSSAVGVGRRVAQRPDSTSIRSTCIRAATPRRVRLREAHPGRLPPP